MDVPPIPCKSPYVFYRVDGFDYASRYSDGINNERHFQKTIQQPSERFLPPPSRVLFPNSVSIAIAIQYISLSLARIDTSGRYLLVCEVTNPIRRRRTNVKRFQIDLIVLPDDNAKAKMGGFLSSWIPVEPKSRHHDMPSGRVLWTAESTSNRIMFILSWYRSEFKKLALPHQENEDPVESINKIQQAILAQHGNQWSCDIIGRHCRR